MSGIILKNITLSILASGIVILAAILGVNLDIFNIIDDFWVKFLWIFLLALIFIPVNYLAYRNEKGITATRQISTSIYLLLNFLFIYYIAFTSLALLDSYKIFFVNFMITLCIILNFIIFDRFRVFERYADISSSYTNIGEMSNRHTVISYKNKYYIFSKISVILWVLGSLGGAGLMAVLVLQDNFIWVEELHLFQVRLFQSIVSPNQTIFLVPNDGDFSRFGLYFLEQRINLGFGIYDTSIFAVTTIGAIIIFTPHSKDKFTNKNILWRKTRSFILAGTILWVINFFGFNVVILFFLNGFSWYGLSLPIFTGFWMLSLNLVVLFYFSLPEMIMTISNIKNNMFKKRAHRKNF